MSRQAPRPGSEAAQLTWTMPPRRGRSARRHLADMYRVAADLDVAMRRVEAEVDFERERNGGRLEREHIEHGDESAYQRHIRQEWPFPEDVGGEPCGCRIAHARYNTRLSGRRQNRDQLTIFDALREA